MSNTVKYSDDYTCINVMALSTDNDSAVELLKKCFSGLNCSSDCSSCIHSLGYVNLKLFTKYPGVDVLKQSHEFIDFLLISVPEGHQLESEILDYAETKFDARARFLVEGGDRTLPSTVISANTETILSQIKDFSKDLHIFKEKYLTGDSSDLTVLRTRFNLGNVKNHLPHELILFYVELLPKLQSMIKSFENFDSNRGYSKNSMKFDFSPIEIESNGVGFKLNILAGEAFDENNKNLPLTVRENPITGSIELLAKSPEQADEVISLLKSVYQMIESMGIIESLKNSFLFSVSFSKDESSVFIDFVLGGEFGEGIINKVRSLNFSKFNYSFSDIIRVQTDLNLSEVWKNPDLDNIINKLSTLTVQGEGKLLNFRTIFHFIKEFVVHTQLDT